MTSRGTKPSRGPHLLLRLLEHVGWVAAFGSRSARLISVAALADAAGTGIAAACLPFYLIRHAHLSTLEVAVALTVAGAAELIGAVPNGIFAQRIGVQRYLAGLQGLQALLWTGLAFTTDLGAAIVLLGLIGLGRGGLGGLSQSFTAAAVGTSRRSEVLGAVRSLRNVGYLLAGGIVAAVLALGGTTTLTVALLLNAVSYIVGALCVRRIRTNAAPANSESAPDDSESAPDDSESAPDNSEPAPKAFGVLRDPGYASLIPSAAVFATTAAVLDVGLPLWVIRHHQIPAAIVGIVLVINTVLVVLVQFRIAQRLASLRSAARGIQFSAGALFVSAICIGLSGQLGTFAAVVVLIVAALTLTLAELVESPSWWTVSFELAPPSRRDEYLAAFDLSASLVALVGPALLTVVVAAGFFGWIGYGAAAILAAILASAVVRRRAEIGGRAHV